MSRRGFPSTDDWNKIGERLLAIAAAALRDSMTKRCGASVTSFTIQSPDARSTRVITGDSDLVARELGTSGHPPRPFIGPQSEDLNALNDSLREALRKESM